MRLSDQIKSKKERSAVAGAAMADKPVGRPPVAPAAAPMPLPVSFRPAGKKGPFRLADLIFKKRDKPAESRETIFSEARARPPVAKAMGGRPDLVTAPPVRRERSAAEAGAADSGPTLRLTDLLTRSRAARDKPRGVSGSAPAQRGAGLTPILMPAPDEEKEAAAVTSQLQGGKMARHEVAPYVGPQLAEAIGIATPITDPLPAAAEAPSKPVATAAPPPAEQLEPVAESALSAGKKAEVASAKVYEDRPLHIYEVARQMGIEVSGERTEPFEQARLSLETVFKKIRQSKPEQYMLWPMVKSIASDLKGILVDDGTILTMLHRYRVEKDKLLWHSLYTTILAMGMAQGEKELACSPDEIGAAALLHDVGLLFQGNGSDAVVDYESAPIFFEHVARGVDLCRKLEVPHIVLTMISQHHGQLDGQGYPKDLTPATFDRCSQILAIANIFEQAIFNIAAEKAGGELEDIEPGHITQAFRQYRKAFNLDLLKKMIGLVGFYPAGTMVELNNRAICEVVRPNHDFPLRPVVKVIIDSGGEHPEDEKLIDLKEARILSVIRALARVERKP